MKIILPQYRENFLGLSGKIRLKRGYPWTNLEKEDTALYYGKWRMMPFLKKLRCKHDLNADTEQYQTGGGWMSDNWHRTVCLECGKPLTKWLVG